MKTSRTVICAAIAAHAIWSAACSDLITLDLGAPSPQSFRATGQVDDDGCFLPDGLQGCRPLAGVRVEVMDGPDKGRYAVTGSNGRVDLGTLTTEPPACFLCGTPWIRLSASKEGWVTAYGVVGPPGAGTFTIRMGDEPHVLWGRVYLPGDLPRPPAAGVRVEILDGPNAGKVTLTGSDGIYQFDDCLSSPSFAMQFSLDGYQTQALSGLSMTQNKNVPAVVLVGS